MVSSTKMRLFISTLAKLRTKKVDLKSHKITLTCPQADLKNNGLWLVRRVQERAKIKRTMIALLTG